MATETKILCPQLLATAHPNHGEIKFGRCIDCGYVMDPPILPGALGGQIELFKTLEERYERVITLAAYGFNYFVGFHDGNEDGRAYGLTFGKPEWVAEGHLYVRDLEGLIH